MLIESYQFVQHLTMRYSLMVLSDRPLMIDRQFRYCFNIIQVLIDCIEITLYKLPARFNGNMRIICYNVIDMPEEYKHIIN